MDFFYRALERVVKPSMGMFIEMQLLVFFRWAMVLFGLIIFTTSLNPSQQQDMRVFTAHSSGFKQLFSVEMQVGSSVDKPRMKISIKLSRKLIQYRPPEPPHSVLPKPPVLATDRATYSSTKVPQEELAYNDKITRVFRKLVNVDIQKPPSMRVNETFETDAFHVDYGVSRTHPPKNNSH